MSSTAGTNLSSTGGDCYPGSGDTGGGTDPVLGCTDMMACNYDQTATEDDGSCEFESCTGCMDMSAENYDMDATIPCDDCCVYAPPVFNVYRDGELVESGIEGFSYTDGGLEQSTEYCYIVEMVENGMVVGSSNEACATTNDAFLLSIIQIYLRLPV